MKKVPHQKEGERRRPRNRQVSTWRRLMGVLFNRYRYHASANAKVIEAQAKNVQESRQSKVGFSTRPKQELGEAQIPFTLPKVQEGFLDLDEALSPDTIRARLIESAASQNSEVNSSARDRMIYLMSQNPVRTSEAEVMLQDTQQGFIPNELAKMTPQGDTAPGRAIFISEEEGK